MNNYLPVVTLQNGLRIGNFSSPHPFTFDDGTVLAACTSQRAKALMLESVESEESFELVRDPSIGWADIRLEFRMSSAVDDELNRLEADDSIDLVIVPLPVMQCIRERYGNDIGKFRVCRVADRVTKTIHSDRFCI